MNYISRVFTLFVCFTIFGTMPLLGRNCPTADLSGDCIVDWNDLIIFSSQWLDNPGGSANLDGLAGVDTSDFAVLASQWLEHGDEEITLVINEFMADNAGFVLDNAGQEDDWIEIYNYGSESVDIGGMYLTDEIGSLSPWLIPDTAAEQTTIPAGGYLVLWADNDLDQGILHLGFKLSASGDEDVVLLDKNSQVVDSIIDFGQQGSNTSYGRLPDAGAQWSTFAVNTDNPPTPGRSNGGRSPDDGIVVTEIMYHPYNADHPMIEDIGEEYIELYNDSFSAVNLENWQITDGVDFVFPSVSIGPGEYLVVASEVSTFNSKYPDIQNVIGGWNGRLSNSGEDLELSNAAGRLIDKVPYSDEGQWALRVPGPIDNSHRGWAWSDDHDGGGMSHELISKDMPNEYGQNWAASKILNGTPGTDNSVAVDQTVMDIAPMIIEAKHRPIIPRSSDSVTVTAAIIDEEATGFGTRVNYRIDGQPKFSEITMNDDGVNGDATANDSVFSVFIPAQADGSVIEFYVEAIDAAGNSRTWPNAVDVDGVLQQRCNALYQVDDAFDPEAEWTGGSQPIYYIIMTDSERAELARIGSTSGESNSNAQMNATFISRDGVDIKNRYNVGVRNRGHGSRRANPNNYRVNFNSDRAWKKVFAINLNAYSSWVQLAGSAVFQRSGLPIGNASAVQVRINGSNLAGTGSRTYGSYAHVEVINSEWADSHFPNDSSGNIYKCMRLDSQFSYQADLGYRGTAPDPYRLVYFKHTNASQDDWSDLIDLTYAMSDNTADDVYMDEVNGVLNVDILVRALALNTLLDNTETTLANGVGDDYYLYRGSVDKRFLMVQYDLDSILGISQSSPTAELFKFMNIPSLNRLISHPNVAPRYYAHLKNLIETTMSEQEISKLLDNLLGDFVPASVVNSMKSFVSTRNNHVLSLIPSELTVESDLLEVGDYYQTGNEEVVLSGFADTIKTRSVTVNGIVADFSPIDGQWSIGDGAANASEEVVVPRGSAWKYFDAGTDLGTAWSGFGFDDSTWSSGAGRLGYGGDGEVTEISYGPDSSNKHITAYFRHTFIADDASNYKNLRLSIARDDGAVVYLNGNEVARSNMPSGEISFITFSSNTASGSDETTFFDYFIDSSLLNNGTNVLAVEIHQTEIDSSDLGFDLELSGQIETNPATNGASVNPGITRMTVKAFDGPGGTGNELDSTYIDVWLNDSVPTVLSGTLTEDTVLDVASGPYRITGDLVIPSGITLTIEAGTTLFFSTGTGITINGKLAAEGIENSHIRMAPEPGSSVRWEGLNFRNTLEDNRLVYVDMEYGDAQGDSILVTSAKLFVDNMTFKSTNNSTAFMELTNPSVLIRNTSFPSISTSEPIHGRYLSGQQYLIFDGCTFGITTGYNDIVDFTGGVRPGPIIQFYNCRFLGGGDDGPDLDGTDAHIEGCHFENFHQAAGSSSPSYAIATGDGSEVCIVRNVFIDNDHAVLHKEDVYTWFQNNVSTDYHVLLNEVRSILQEEEKLPDIDIDSPVEKTAIDESKQEAEDIAGDKSLGWVLT